MNFVSASSRTDVDVVGAKEIETRGCFVMSMELGLWRLKFARFDDDRK
jgi:hypothetical protein